MGGCAFRQSNNQANEWKIQNITDSHAKAFTVGYMGESFVGCNITNESKVFLKIILLDEQNQIKLLSVEDRLNILKQFNDNTYRERYCIIVSKPKYKDNTLLSGINHDKVINKSIFQIFSEIVNIISSFDRYVLENILNKHALSIYIDVNGEMLQYIENNDSHYDENNNKKTLIKGKFFSSIKNIPSLKEIDLNNENLVPEYRLQKLKNNSQLNEEINIRSVLVYTLGLFLLEFMDISSFSSHFDFKNINEIATETQKMLEILEEIFSKKENYLNIFSLIKSILHSDHTNRIDFEELRIVTASIESLKHLKLVNHAYKSIKNNESHYQLGILLLYPKVSGVKRYFNKALKWFQLAAQQSNHLKSKYYIAMMYYRGWGLKKDHYSAFLKYEELHKSHLESKAMLGLMYIKGQGTEKDVKKGKILLEESANGHCSLAYNNLGLYYLEENEYYSYSKAYEYLKKAADKGETYAKSNLAYLLALKGRTSFDYKLALDNVLSAITEGNEEAKAILAFIYLKGVGVERSFTKSLGLYYSAARDGYFKAFLSIANFYLYGAGVRKDGSLALRYFIEAGRCGCGEGYTNAGYMYFYGLGVKQNSFEALDMYVKGVESNDKMSMKNLAIMYRNGSGISRDISKAIELEIQAGEGNLESVKKHFNYLMDKSYFV